MNKKIIVVLVSVILLLLIGLLFINNKSRYIKAEIKDIYKDNNSTILFVHSKSNGDFELIIGKNTKIIYKGKAIKESKLNIGDNILISAGNTMLLKEPPVLSEVYKIIVVEK